MTARSSVARASDDKLWRFVKKIVRHYAREFNLPLRHVGPLSPKKRFYGDCTNDGYIRIQYQNVEAYQLFDTMSHELAHLVSQKHKARWFAMHIRILTKMAQDDVYGRLKKLCKKNR